MNAEDSSRIQKYLGIEQPPPAERPIYFLKSNLSYLPRELLMLFSSVLSPKERSVILAIRNRRSKYAQSAPRELSWIIAKNTWPLLWEGRERRGIQEGQEEREWARENFLGGERKPHVGKLGVLLGGYEEEREAERVRVLRRERVEQEAALPEEDEETDSDEEDVADLPPEEPPTDEEMKQDFERLIQERFIYGLLEVRCPLHLRHFRWLISIWIYRVPIMIKLIGTTDGTSITWM
jgi:hypothetical protein